MALEKTECKNPVCDKVFTKRRKTNYFCCRQCVADYKKVGVIEKPCDCGCGRIVTRKPFNAKNGFYFDKSCYHRSRVKQSESSRICGKCYEEKSLNCFRIKKNSNFTVSSCKECEKNRHKDFARTLHGRWMFAKKRAAQRDIEWNLDKEIYAALIKEKCHYCSGKLQKTGVGLDRKANEFGYICENVVPCCKICNIVKNDHFTYNEMMLLSPTLIAIRNTKEKNHVSNT